MAEKRHARNHPELLPRASWEDVTTCYRLTRRELSTLRMVCRGLSNAKITTQMGVSHSTVRTHLRSIYDKLDCNGRVDAILTLIHRYVKK